VGDLAAEVVFVAWLVPAGWANHRGGQPMKRWRKWSLGLVGLLHVLVVGVAVFDYQRHERQRLERSVDQLASLEQEFADLRAG
jgi:hypothetical protein